jgi:hypothetical protein
MHNIAQFLVKTQQVVRTRGQRCGDIELTVYLANTEGLVSLVLDLRNAHDRSGSSSDPSINGHLHYPNDLDGPLNETVTDKIRQYRADCNNRPSNFISIMTTITCTSGHLHCEFVCLYFCKLIGKLTAFLHGVQLVQSNHFQFRRVVFS